MVVKEKAVSKITITGVKDLDLAGATTLTLKAKVTPSKASTEVEWKSSSPKVAKVTNKGKVTAVGEGTAQITATAMDGSKKKATVTITVVNSAANPPTTVPPVDTVTDPVTEDPTTPVPDPVTPAPTDSDFTSGQSAYHYSAASDSLTLTTSTATGHVTVPSQVEGKPVTAIGENALTGGNVNAVTIPESVTTVALQHFPTTVNYIELKGKDTTLTDLDKVTYIIAPAGGISEQTANALGIPFIDASKVHSQDGFLYVVENGQATLLCPVDSSAISGNVTIPETVDGVPVTAVGDHGLDGCSDNITQLTYPESVTVPDGIIDENKLNKLIKVKSIAISGAPAELDAGQTAQLTVEVLPEDATNKEIAWSSSDESVLTVSQEGLITAVAYGTATVTASAQDGSGITAATEAIQVWNLPGTLHIQKENLPDSLDVQAEVQLAYLADPALETLKNAELVWASSDEDVLSVDPQGKVTALAACTDPVTVSVSLKDTEIQDSVVFQRVYALPESVTVTVDKMELTAGESAQASAQVLPDTARQTVTWTSTNHEVLNVGTDGTVTAVAFGQAAVKAETWNQLTGSSDTIQVWNQINGVAIDAGIPAWMDVGNEWTLSAAIDPAMETVRYKELVWSVSDDTVAKIEDGKQIAMAAGTAQVTVAIQNTDFSDSKTIQVYDLPTGIAVSAESNELYAGSSIMLSCVVSPETARQDVTWSSSDNSIATVDQTGCVTGIAGGEVTITAERGTLNDSVTLTVYDLVESISISGAEILDIYNGRNTEAQLVASVIPATAKQGVLWTSSKPEVASVNENGLVTAVAKGKTTITAAALDNSGKTASVEIEVQRNAFEVSENSDGTLTITAFEVEDGKAEIPETYQGKTITALANSLFKNNTDLVTLKLPDTVTVIPESLCEGCSNLTQVVLSNNVTTIEEAAFKNCTSLHAMAAGSIQNNVLVMPEELTAIEAEAFYGTAAVREVELSEKTASIGENAFANSGITRVYLPESLTQIGDGAFPNTVTGYGPAGTAAANYFEEHGLAFEADAGELPAEYFTFAIISDTTCKVTGYTGPTDVDLIIPSKDGSGRSVVEIGSSAFSGRSDITGSLHIPNSVTRISTSAFNNCSGLTGNLTIPGSVKSINTYAFTNCSSITQVTILGNVTAISFGSFKGCSNLTEIYMPDSVKTIGQDAFYQCKALKNIQMPATIESIGMSAFKYCESLEEITLPESLTIIEKETFSNCSGLTSIVFPDSITEIGESAFAKTGITEIILPPYLRILGASAFYGCEISGTIEIPETLEVMGSRSFEYYAPILFTARYDGNAAKALGLSSYSFVDPVLNPELTLRYDQVDENQELYVIDIDGEADVSIPEGVYGINLSGFPSFTSLTVPDSLQYLNIAYFSGEILDGIIREIYLPDEGLIITGNTYGYSSSYILCASLGSTTAKDISRIGGFGFCDKNISSQFILKYEFAEDSDEILGLIAAGLRDDVVNAVIPEIVTKLNNGCFFRKSNLQKVYIPDNFVAFDENTFPDEIILCANIGSNAAMKAGECGYSFRDEEKAPGLFLKYNSTDTETIELILTGADGDLTEVEIPDVVTRIGEHAFSKCHDLEIIRIPANIIYINDFAFIDSSRPNLLKVFFDGAPDFGNYAFSDTILYANIGSEIAEKLSTKGLNFRSPDEPKLALIYQDNGLAVISCDNNATVVSVPETVEIIGTEAFAYCESLTNVHLPDSLRTIGYRAFRHCTSLTEISLPEGVMTIGAYAFEYCSGLTGDLTIPDSVTIIGEYAFYGCTGFNGSLMIGNNVTSIESFAFSGCSGLTGNLIIGSNVKNINQRAFYHCYGLTGRLMIPASVTSIDLAAFDGCSNLERINVIISPDNGLPYTVSRIAVYCPKDSYAWSWATTKSDFEPVEWDGTLTNQLEGSFTNHNLTITLGERVIPDGIVMSSLDDIHRVTLTITGWNGDGTDNNRYASYMCSELHTKELNLEDWSVFTLDTTKEPLNVPGEYTINLWASTIEGQGIKLDSMTVNVVSAENMLSGTVKTASGEPIPYVYVTAINSVDESDVHYAQTNNDGIWSMEVTPGATYNVSYWHVSYSVNGSEASAVAGSNLTATATLNGDIDQTYGFVMKKADGSDLDVTEDNIPTILVNQTVQFKVYAPGCSYVRLIVDGKCYDQPVEVENEWAIYDRAFNLSKDIPRQVQFQVLKDGEADFSAFTPVRLLYVTCEKDHKLDNVIFNEISTYSLNSSEPLTISWKPVNHAVGYNVYFYYDGIGRIFPYNENSNQTYTETPDFIYKSDFPDLFVGEGWYVQVVAVGEVGWNSSNTQSSNFTIVKSTAQAYIDILTEGNKAKVGSFIDGSIYHDESVLVYCYVHRPDMEPDERETIELDNNIFRIPVEEPGEYVIYLYDVDNNVLDTVTIIADEPEVIDFDVNGYNRYEWELKGKKLEFHVDYSFVPNMVSIYRNGIELTGEKEKINNDKGLTSLTLQTTLDNEGEKSIYCVVATYGNGNTVCTKDFPVYCMMPQELKYEQRKITESVFANLTPDLVSDIDIETGTNIIIGEGYYQNFWLIIYNGIEYFVDKSVISPPEEFVTIPVQSIHIVAPKRVNVGDEFKVYIETKPKNATFEDNVLWYINDVSIISYRGCLQEEGELAGIVSSFPTSIIMRANNMGTTYIVAYNSDGTLEDSCGIEVTYDDIINIENNEENYYELLRNCQEANKLKNINIYNLALSEIMRSGVDANTAKELLNIVKGCNNVTFRDLYLWSLFDYSRYINDPTCTSGGFFSNGVAHFKDSGQRETTWFHESGHAIDWTLNRQYISVSSRYKDEIFNSILESTTKYIKEVVNNTYHSLYNTNEPGGSIDLQSDQIVDLITNEIIGPDNAPTATTRRISYGLEGILQYYDIPLPASVPYQYSNLWLKSLKNCSEKIQMNYISSFLWYLQETSNMLCDMISGMTNNTIYVYGGHGKPSDKEQDDDEQYYWFMDDGTPRYSQNLDAWAEYFASVITGNNKDDNETNFHRTCWKMQLMAEELLNGYKEIHSDSKKGVGE